MSLVKEGKLVYPLKIYTVHFGNATQSRLVPRDSTALVTSNGDTFVVGGERGLVYDRDTRGKSWFILDLAIIRERFVPKESTGLLTSDGETFLSGSERRKEFR